VMKLLSQSIIKNLMPLQMEYLNFIRIYTKRIQNDSDGRLIYNVRYHRSDDLWYAAYIIYMENKY